MITHTRPSTPSMMRLAGVVAILALACETWGGRLEFEETDTLPQVENFLFSASHVGIVSHDGRWFALNRQTQRVHQHRGTAVCPAVSQTLASESL